MILSTLASILLGNVLVGRGFVRSGYRNKQGKGVVRAVYGSPLKKSSNSTTFFHKF